MKFHSLQANQILDCIVQIHYVNIVIVFEILFANFLRKFCFVSDFKNN